MNMIATASVGVGVVLLGIQVQTVSMQEAYPVEDMGLLGISEIF